MFTTARASFARLTLDSEPGDYIGQGSRFDITYETNRGDTISADIFRRLPDGTPAQLLWILYGSSNLENKYASISFGTDALDIPIMLGDYPEARRSGFATSGFAGLEVSFQNRCSNQVFGSFTIREVTFTTPDPLRILTPLQILTFDAEFLQRSESPNAPALRGQFQYKLL
jgi:hypothetical protein